MLKNKSENEIEKKYLFVQLGSPKAPDKESLKVYLREFLGDPRVVDLPRFFWLSLLYLIILPLRSRSSAQLYKRVWDGEQFPLIKYSNMFIKEVQKTLPSADLCFLISKPELRNYFKNYKDYQKYHWVIVPLFPQYCEATTASVYDQLNISLQQLVIIPSFEFVPYFYNSQAFIQGIVRNIFCIPVKAQALIISFHGIPLRRIHAKKDPYYNHCIGTFNEIKNQLLSQLEDKDIPIFIAFQSRFGSEQWIGPYLDDVVEKVNELGFKEILICAPSFVVDCLETSDEIGHELKNQALEKYDMNIHLVPALNADPQWCKEFALYIQTEEWKKGLFSMEVAQEEIPKLKSPPLTPQAKSVISIMFLTLFLDLVGFSIIFPLFPAMAKYYLENDADNMFLKIIFGFVTNLFSSSGTSTIVLFGGILGALYSFLQFLAAPFWGKLSDKVGRRPVLLVSLAFLIISYAMWFFAGSFTILILARIVGGLMAGNISTATAVIADVTQKENRSKGMAFVGMAFAFGFILGPALGGIFSQWNLVNINPNLSNYGINPFSIPAAIAFILSLFNIIWIYHKFPETLPVEKRKNKEVENYRSSNPLLLFRPLPYEGVNLVTFGHFLFLLAFSGMEFTLTFLAVERLKFSSLDNAYMFIFIGFILALVQGGFVRRKAHSIGEKKLVLRGLLLLIPGLILIGLTESTFFLYFGLFFLAVGSGIIIPCLTSLVSLLTPPTHQGESIGIFRSLGALSRVIGPLLASIIYWKWGSAYPYYLGSLFIILPFILVLKVPKDKFNEQS